MKIIVSMLLSGALLMAAYSQVASASSLNSYELCLYDLDVCLASTK